LLLNIDHVRLPLSPEITGFATTHRVLAAPKAQNSSADSRG